MEDSEIIGLFWDRGIDFPDNPVLEDALWDELHLITEYGEELHYHCVIRLLTGDKPEPYCVDAEFAYRIDGFGVQVMYRWPTEKNPYESGGGVRIDEEEATIRQHITDGGRTWDIYIWEYQDECLSGIALGKVNGALTWIQIPVVPASWDGSEEEIVELLIEIAEAYA